MNHYLHLDMKHYSHLDNLQINVGQNGVSLHR